MNLEDVDVSLSSRWFKIFESSFLILPASEQLKADLKSASLNGLIESDQLVKCLVQHTLIDWSGVKHVSGDDLEFNRENATIALSTKPELTHFVVSKAFEVQ